MEKLNIKDKVVLVRSDLNVPHKDGKITDINRIIQSLPTLKWVIDGGAKLVICSHLGRVKNDKDKLKNNLIIVANELEKHLGKKICFINKTRGHELENAIKDHNIVMFQNTRYEDFVDGKVTNYESNNNGELAKYWANLCDIFINDAFGTAHREHASNVGITTYAKQAVPGLLLNKEINCLTKALSNPKHPYVAILGGAKVSDKIEIIKSMISIADKIIIGGAMAYTFIKAKGISIGSSMVENDKLDLAKELMELAGDKLILPIDHLITESFDSKKCKISSENIDSDFMALDIGPRTIELYKKQLVGAKTVIWNGPMGVFENEMYENGTKEIALAITEINNVFSIIGGGDSAAAAIKFKIDDKFSHVSTGGGASLEFLEGKTLPAIEAMNKK